MRRIFLLSAVTLTALFWAAEALSAGRIAVKAEELDANTYYRLVMLPNGDVVHLASLHVSALHDVYNPGDTLVYNVQNDTMIVRRNASPSELLLAEPFAPVTIEPVTFADVDVASEVALYDDASRYFYSSLPGYPYQAATLDGDNRLIYVGTIEVPYLVWQPAINPFQPDDDVDSVPNAADNCIIAPNGPNDTATAGPAQNDTNSDGFGNRCDADLNGDCVVNPIDLGLFRSVYFSADADADLNGDGVVNPIDLGIFRSLYFAPPGPSGIPNDCP